MTTLSILFTLTSGYLLAGIVYFARRRTGYSHVRHTISELGEVGAVDQRAVGFGLFLPVGMALLGAGLYTYLIPSPGTYVPGLTGLSVVIGVGYVIAAFFPCDGGSPSRGTTRQQIHNIGGFIEYVGGAYYLVRAAGTLPGAGFDLAGYVVLAVAILLSVPPLFPWRGLIQRVGEIVLLGALIALSLG